MESAGINSGGGWVRGEITRGIVETERSGRQHTVCVAVIGGNGYPVLPGIRQDQNRGKGLFLSMFLSSLSIATF